MLQFFAHPFDALATRTASGKRMGLPALRFRLGLFERKLRIASCRLNRSGALIHAASGDGQNRSNGFSNIVKKAERSFF
jgi:hypothetical protein